MTKTQAILDADIIDLRDVTERVEALHNDRENFIEQCIIHTSCRFCGQDIEGSRADEDWRDRGNNSGCDNEVGAPVPDGGLAHEPTDEALSDTEYERGRWADENPDEATELSFLETLLDELCDSCGDHWYPGSLIADHYFEDYARDLAEDIGAINRDAPWPACHIDWEAASDALKMDYSSVEIDGQTYWYR